MSDEDVAMFRSLEQMLLRPEVRRSRNALEALLADDFLELGSSGRVYDRSSVVKALAGQIGPIDAALPEILDLAVRRLGPDIVLVTYQSVSVADGHTVRRSSIWQRYDGNWRMVFHQGTPVK